jgi:hypothetical protein
MPHFSHIVAIGVIGAALCGAGATGQTLARKAPPPGAGLLAQSGMLAQSGLPLSGLARSVPLSPALECRQAIAAAERAGNIPTPLMAAIARIESGRPDAQGVVNPWPWTINAEGEGHYYASKAAAIAAARAMQARGIRSMDVGCMQVNLMHHPDAFASLDQAFDPMANAVYAAHFLNQLFAQTGDWAKATAAYHSWTPGIGDDYERKVAMVLPDERRRMGGNSGIPAGNVWSTNVWSANVWTAHGAAWPAPAGPLAPAAMAAGAAGGGYMLSNKTGNARLLPAARGTVGRSLAAYRAAPVAVASGAAASGQIALTLPRGNAAAR